MHWMFGDALQYVCEPSQGIDVVEARRLCRTANYAERPGKAKQIPMQSLVERNWRSA